MTTELPASSVSGYISLLAEAHNFELIPGKALVVAGKGHTNNLIIAIFDHEHRYMLSQTVTQDNTEVPGFRVYYDLDWNPVQAVEANTTPIDNLEAADAEMFSFVATFCDSLATQ
jgi:hypothetical protein